MHSDKRKLREKEKENGRPCLSCFFKPLANSLHDKSTVVEEVPVNVHFYNIIYIFIKMNRGYRISDFSAVSYAQKYGQKKHKCKKRC